MISTKYNDYVTAIVNLGYTINDGLAKETYQPATTAHKSFFLEAIDKSGTGITGRVEMTSIDFALSVLMLRMGALSTNTKDNLAEVEALEKGLLEFSVTNGDVLSSISWKVLNSGNMQLYQIIFSIEFQRSTKV